MKRGGGPLGVELERPLAGNVDGSLGRFRRDRAGGQRACAKVKLHPHVAFQQQRLERPFLLGGAGLAGRQQHLHLATAAMIASQAELHRMRGPQPIFQQVDVAGGDLQIVVDARALGLR